MFPAAKCSRYHGCQLIIPKYDSAVMVRNPQLGPHDAAEERYLLRSIGVTFDLLRSIDVTFDLLGSILDIFCHLPGCFRPQNAPLPALNSEKFPIDHPILPPQFPRTKPR